MIPFVIPVIHSCKMSKMKGYFQSVPRTASVEVGRKRRQGGKKKTKKREENAN
jgi:hypothetical protein